MRIGLVLQPYTDENMRLAAQLGATEVVTGMPAGDYADLALLKSRIEDAGLRLNVLEGLVPMNEVVMGTTGRDEEIENFKRNPNFTDHLQQAVGYFYPIVHPIPIGCQILA